MGTALKQYKGWKFLTPQEGSIRDSEYQRIYGKIKDLKDVSVAKLA